MKIKFRKVLESDSQWIKTLLEKEWGSIFIVSRGQKYNALKSPGIVALLNNKPVGFLTYHPEGEKFEILTLNSMMKGKGVGTGLINEIIKLAKNEIVKSIWMITTNDNKKALEFYMNRGFTIKAIHKNAIAESRKIKPEIPLFGENGIPISDEIELELSI